MEIVSQKQKFGKKKEKKYIGLRTLMKFYKKHWVFLGLYVIVLLIKACISFFDAMFIAKTIACIMESGDFKGALINAGISLGITTFGALLSILNTYFYKQVENRSKIDIQQYILRKSLDIQMKSYDIMGSGVIVTRLTSDIDAISTEFKSFTTRVVDLIRKFSYVIYIFFLNYYLGFFLVGTIILTIIAYSVRVHYLTKLKPDVRRSIEKVNSKIIEIIRGVKDIKTLNCTDSTLKTIEKDQKEFVRRDNHEWYVGITLVEISKIIQYICNFLFIFLCVYFLRMESLTPLIFYTCFLYKDHMLDFAQIFGDLQINLGSAEVHAMRIFKIADPTIYEEDVYGDKTIENFSGKVTFKNVNFKYNTSKKVLKNASFEILPKQTVAFVGESGCGKSTIISLIAHLYYKNSGQILFDDVPIEELSKDFIRENIAVVNQFPYIFNISIRDNFKLIKPDITDEEIYELCKQTDILNHVKKLPLGLDSIIGENGCQFSGGQRQKICIARALARDVKIMIFDEATSALDNSSQKEIMKVIEKLKNKVTIILIAHRLSTITYADCIYLLDKGKIIGQGKHEELLESNEFYSTLYQNAENKDKENAKKKI